VLLSYLRSFLFLMPLCLIVDLSAAIEPEGASDRELAAKIMGTWLGREIVSGSEMVTQTTYRPDGRLERSAQLTQDGRHFKISVKGRWKVEHGQLISAGESFSGYTQTARDNSIAVTNGNLLLRTDAGRLIHKIRKQ
jgi:hypothetical protein